MYKKDSVGKGSQYSAVSSILSKYSINVSFFFFKQMKKEAQVTWLPLAELEPSSPEVSAHSAPAGEQL